MTIEAPPLWLQGGTYPARLDRFLTAQLYDEGVLGPLACKVSQRGAGANFSVDVAVGEFVVQGDDQSLQGNYMARVTATENAAISAAPGSNSRYDLVTLRVNDPNAGGNTGNTVTVVVVTGTASASPAVPALPASSIPLAVIGPIATATASITNSLIHDAWTGTGPAFATSCRLTAGQKAPVGKIDTMGGGADKINGWLYCNGAAVSRATYANLFGVISTRYGVGDGSTTFNLPDGRDRVMVAKGTTFATVGAVGGEVNHTLTTGELAAHNHGVTDPTHLHSVDPPSTALSLSGPGNGVTEGSGSGLYANTVGGTSHLSLFQDTTNTGTVNIAPFNSASASTGISINNNGSGTPHNNMQPYQVIDGYVIRT